MTFPACASTLYLELGIAALISQLAQLDRQRISALDREELGWVLSKGIADGWKQFLTRPNAEVLGESTPTFPHSSSTYPP
jgi:hypothetical protein